MYIYILSTNDIKEFSNVLHCVLIITTSFLLLLTFVLDLQTVNIDQKQNERKKTTKKKKNNKYYRQLKEKGGEKKFFEQEKLSEREERDKS